MVLGVDREERAGKGKEKAGEADLPDDVAQAYIDAGFAERAKKNPLDHDGDGTPGGSLPGDHSTAAKGKRAKAGDHSTAEPAPDAQDVAP